jgi:hypothetical protein
MNWYLVFSLIARVISLILLGWYVIPRQIHEVRRVVDGFSRLRWYVLVWIFLFVISGLPIILYQYLSLTGRISVDLFHIANVASGFASLCVAVVLVLIYNYKYEE